MIVQNIKHIEFNEDKKNNVTPSKKWASFLIFCENTHKKSDYDAIYFFRGNKSNCYLSLVLFNKSFLTLAMIIVCSHYSSPFLLIWQSNRHFRISKLLFRWKVKLKFQNFCKNFYFLLCGYFVFVFVLSFVVRFRMKQRSQILLFLVKLYQSYYKNNHIMIPRFHLSRFF